jgi:hypothetical protein
MKKIAYILALGLSVMLFEHGHTGVGGSSLPSTGYVQTSTAVIRTEVKTLTTSVQTISVSEDTWIEPVFDFTTDITYSSSLSQTFSFATNRGTQLIAYGYVHISSMSTATANYDGAVSFYTSNTFSEDYVQYKVALDLLSTQITQTGTIGNYSLLVSDSTSYTQNQYVHITSSAGSEYLRVSGVSTGEISFSSALKYSHTLYGTIRQATDFGGQIIDADKIYGKIEVSPAFTGVLRVFVKSK